MLINHRLYRRTEYKIGHRGQSRTAASWFQARDATVTSLGDKLGRGTWNRTKISEFKARCDKPLHYTPTKICHYSIDPSEGYMYCSSVVSILKHTKLLRLQ